MDIDLLSKMVKELILDNDKVVLPGLGAFVAEIVPSTFSDKGYTINPPYRKLYFRSRPSEGKELAELYASGNDVELAVAERIIRDFVAELKSILYTRKAVAFPGLGRLRATKENNVFFIADEDLDIYPEGFGLEPISLKTHQETREEVAAAVEDLKSLLEHDPEPEIIPVAKEEPVIEEEPEILPVAEDEPVEPEILPVVEDEPEIIPDTEEDEIVEDAPESVEDETIEEGSEAIEKEQAPEIISPKTKPNVKKILFLVLGIIIAAIILLLAALAVLGRTNPEFIDSLLYTPEELKILNQIL